MDMLVTKPEVRVPFFPRVTLIASFCSNAASVHAPTRADAATSGLNRIYIRRILYYVVCFGSYSSFILRILASSQAPVLDPPPKAATAPASFFFLFFSWVSRSLRALTCCRLLCRAVPAKPALAGFPIERCELPPRVPRQAKHPRQRRRVRNRVVSPRSCPLSRRILKARHGLVSWASEHIPVFGMFFDSRGCMHGGDCLDI